MTAENSIQTEKVVERLRKNNFMVYLVENSISARELFFSSILPEIKPESVSYADSMTLRATGILEKLKQEQDLKIIDTFNHKLTWDEKIEIRRQALLTDLFLTGTNAVTANGELVNLDMIGNRTTGIVFGPKNVVLTIGINKIVKNLDDAKKRIKTISAPLNAKRHENFNLPCQKTGYCVNCDSDQRICNTWSIIEKCFPKNRIRIILIDEISGL